ncbi:MAG: hypothetical protein NXI31_18035 [bacterium]|nr:hypothetical protein [bacterium]
MPASNPVAASDETFQAVLLRSLASGAAVTVGLGGLAWAIGAAPAGTEGFLGLGIAVAILAAVAAMWVNGRFLATRSGAGGLPADPAILAGRMQGLLAAALMVKLAVLVIAMFALFRFGVKFEATATFCIAFASASLVVQLTAAGLLSRHLGQRHNAALAARVDRSAVNPAGPGASEGFPAESNHGRPTATDDR